MGLTIEKNSCAEGKVHELEDKAIEITWKNREKTYWSKK